VSGAVRSTAHGGARRGRRAGHGRRGVATRPQAPPKACTTPQTRTRVTSAPARAAPCRTLASRPTRILRTASASASVPASVPPPPPYRPPCRLRLRAAPRACHRPAPPPRVPAPVPHPRTDSRPPCACAPCPPRPLDRASLRPPLCAAAPSPSATHSDTILTVAPVNPQLTAPAGNGFPPWGERAARWVCLPSGGAPRLGGGRSPPSGVSRRFGGPPGRLSDSRLPDGFSWLSTSTPCARRARLTATRSSLTT
jgi:hypothetical protein